jgi:hypothetical protein
MDILMPRSLLLKHPQLAANLRSNQGRLTSHYDFYLTIRHLIRCQHQYDHRGVDDLGYD